MRNPEDQSGPLVTCTCNTGISPVLTGELVAVDWHGLPVQVINIPDQSSGFLLIGPQYVIPSTESMRYEKKGFLLRV